MKALICVALFFLAVDARHHRYRRDATSDIKGLIEQFPKTEFQAFWDKLHEVMGSNQDFFQKRLQENEGNLEMTLSEMKDKLGDNYPQVKEKFDLAKEKMDKLIKRMDEITLRDVFKAVRNFFQERVDTVDREEAKRRMQDFKNTVYNFFQQLLNYQP